MSGNHIIVAFTALTLFLGTLALTLYTKLQSNVSDLEHEEQTLITLVNVIFRDRVAILMDELMPHPKFRCS